MYLKLNVCKCPNVFKIFLKSILKGEERIVKYITELPHTARIKSQGPDIYIPLKSFSNMEKNI